jgi:preprotein translocase subunit SecE
MLGEARMEAKKTQTRSKKSLFVYIQEMKDELRKVSWTNKKDLKFSTKMVVISTLFFGVGIYSVDFLIKSGLDSIRTIVHFIFG